ncbi:hypothetical protein BX070DRAFT_219679 [Coemansia spiralis]|nr:hypothetical protein BX070DRAFT_219679 [Coemansia spiralis]
MFGSTHNQGATAGHAQNKENAVLGSVARAGKTGLLNGKAGAGSAHPAKMPGKPTASFGTSSHSNMMTPGKKPADGKQQATRIGLRNIAQTPSSARSQVATAQRQDKTTRTIKRRQGLFTPAAQQASTKLHTHLKQQQQALDILQLLEPEYVSVRPIPLPFDALEEFGCDLDVSIVPMTQRSIPIERAIKLPLLDLEYEALIEIPSTPPSDFGESKIPRPGSLGFLQLDCKPMPLIANAFYPSRIPQLKRKR